MVGGRRHEAASSTCAALAYRARCARLMICGGARSMAPSRYCSSAVRGAIHSVSTVSSSSCRATWPEGARATKNRVSKRRLDMLGATGVIQRDHGSRARVCRRRARVSSTLVKACPPRRRLRASAASTPWPAVWGSASSKPHSSSASRNAATYRAAAVAGVVLASPNCCARVEWGWSRWLAPSVKWSSPSSFPPGKT